MSHFGVCLCRVVGEKEEKYVDEGKTQMIFSHK